MLESAGSPVVAGEELLVHANDLARHATAIPVDPTGSAGLAGLLALRGAGLVADDERVAVLYTGVDRSKTNERKDERDAELSRSRHPVAEGLRAH